MTDPADRLYEHVLILRCQAGDGTAFEELVRRYSARIRFYLRKLIGVEGDIDDTLQEVWFDVFKALPRLADPAAFPSWIYRLARDRAFRRLRRYRPTCQLDGEDELTDRVGIEDEFTADDVAGIRNALDRLPAEHREVLVLRFLEEMPYEDVARVVGCPLGTVKSRIYHAKRSLRRAIEETRGET